jgi:hypothetical protein
MEMTTRSFSNWSQIETYLQSIVNEVLLDEVSDAVRDEIESSISEEVFIQDPVWYQRRSEGNGLNSGGLADKAEMEAILISNGVVSIEDKALPSKTWNNGKTLAENIEYGYNNMDHWWDQPRPFIANAKENLKQTKAHVDSMRDGLIKRGLDVV